MPILFLSIPCQAYVNLTGLWFGNGGDKVPRQNLWPQGNCSTCTLTLNWDGTTASLAGFKNEMIGGMLTLQGGITDAQNVKVQMSPLTIAGGSSVISSTAVLCANVTNYTTRDFEILVATYVQIVGMTENSWNAPEYDEKDIPPRFQNPYTVQGNGNNLVNPPNHWETRPDANKFFPDALVPQECLANGFTVAASSSQGVWFDFYLRKTISTGTYSGTITIFEGVTISSTVPIKITVYNGTMPDVPHYNYIADVSEDDINYRLNGIAHNNGCTTATCVATDETFYNTLHRHRLIPIGDVPDINTNFYPSAKYQLQLNGTLFTSTYGYQGPGTATGSRIYSIGTYSKWQNNPNWSQSNATTFCVAVSSWGFYFKNNFPVVRSFVYLTDEPTTLTQANLWSTWMSTISSCQTSPYTVHSFVTNDWVNFLPSSAPYVDNPASTDWISKHGYTQANWQSAANYYETQGSTQGWIYNGHPSWEGTVNATEDDGISAWEGVWADFLKGTNGHFQWQTTSWNIQGQGSPAENPLWTQAKTFGYDQFPATSTTMGHNGFNFGNGDGVLLYPGTDTFMPAYNYGFLGPIASLRLKYLRRSINDYDYLAAAYAVNPSSTTNILKALVPKALWDISCFTQTDCSYSYGGRLWDNIPNDWELARQRLAAIIQGTSPGPNTVLQGTLVGEGTASFY